MPASLSICIPTFNRAKVLGELLASIYPQAADEVEIVISDNASTDDTEEMVMRWKRQLPRIVYHRWPENMGADRNFLKVVELANGEYCWLMGSDDLVAEGAIPRLLRKIGTRDDVYMLGLTACTRDMKPLHQHPVLDCQSEREFDLSNPGLRIDYFQRALTTTPLFSYLSSIVVRRSRWMAVEPDETFIGSIWIHVSQILRMIPGGLRVRYLPETFILNRSGNDSFMDRGIVKRIAMTIDGFDRIGTTFFGEGSPESFHYRRTIRNEYTLPFLLHAKLRILENREGEDLDEFHRLVRKLYCDPGIPVRLRRLAILSTPYPVLKVLETVNKGLRAIRGKG